MSKAQLERVRLHAKALHGPTPEGTGKFKCHLCGERESFTGIDAHGTAGDDCECDTYEPDDVCTCEAVLTQDFRVIRDGREWSLDYSSHEGGGSGAEIGEYTTIVCGQCGVIVWENDSDDDRAIGRAKVAVRA